MAITSIRNETPAQLTLIGVGNERLVLAPLQEKAVTDVSSFDFEEAARKGIVSIGEDVPQELSTQIGAVLYGGGVAAFMVAIFLSGLQPSAISPATWKVAAWVIPATILILVIAAMIIRATNSSVLVGRLVAQLMALAVILTIGVGLPAASVYYFGGGQKLFAAAEAPSLALFGRLVQLSFIATASLLPVLLFFLFDRFQLGTLRKRLYRNLFRLDPSLKTVGEIDAKYGFQITEAFGSQDEGQGRLDAGSRWPVLVCAFVMTIAWIVALNPVGTEFNPSDSAQALKVLLPQSTTLVFGFLGVYFYSLRLIAIRYARGDLKPKAYTHITVRILIVAVLSWVLDVVFEGDSRVKLVLAFLFGITPDEFLTWLRETFRGKVPSKLVPELTKLPLSDLEGIDLYDLGRLESEGIVNIEGLAHHELIDLIIDTRMPVPRLIDWVDQSILYLHLVGGSNNSGRAKLRDYGIRTATDLLRAWDEAEKRGSPDFDNFKKLLADEKGPPYRLEVIRDAFLDDEWIKSVLNWRTDAAHDPIEFPAIPSSVEALERWADKQLESQRYSAALNILQRSLQVQDTASTRRRIAQIFATSPTGYRDPGKASENATRAFELALGDYSEISKLIEIYIEIQDYDNAKRALDAALKIVSDWRNSEQRNKGTKRLKEAQKRIEESRRRAQGLETAAVQ